MLPRTPLVISTYLLSFWTWLSPRKLPPLLVSHGFSKVSWRHWRMNRMRRVRHISWGRLRYSRCLVLVGVECIEWDKRVGLPVVLDLGMTEVGGTFDPIHRYQNSTDRLTLSFRTVIPFRYQQSSGMVCSWMLGPRCWALSNWWTRKGCRR